MKFAKLEWVWFRFPGFHVSSSRAFGFHVIVIRKNDQIHTPCSDHGLLDHNVTRVDLETRKEDLVFDVLPLRIWVLKIRGQHRSKKSL